MSREGWQNWGVKGEGWVNGFTRLLSGIASRRELCYFLHQYVFSYLMISHLYRKAALKGFLKPQLGYRRMSFTAVTAYGMEFERESRHDDF